MLSILLSVSSTRLTCAVASSHMRQLRKSDSNISVRWCYLVLDTTLILSLGEETVKEVYIIGDLDVHLASWGIR